MASRVDVSRAKRRFTVLRAKANGNIESELEKELRPVTGSIRSRTPVRTGRLKRSTRALVSRSGRHVRAVVGWIGPFYGVFVEARRGIIRAHEDDARRAVLRAVRKAMRRTAREAESAARR